MDIEINSLSKWCYKQSIHIAWVYLIRNSKNDKSNIQETDQWLPGSRWAGLNGKGHKETSEGDIHILYLDCDDTYIGIYICQNPFVHTWKGIFYCLSQ